MTGRNDGSNGPDEQTAREEAEERERQAAEAARARRRRIGHAGAAAAGTAAGAVASGAAGEMDIIGQLTGDDAAAAETEEEAPSLDVFDDVVAERTQAAMESAQRVLDNVESARAAPLADLGAPAVADATPGASVTPPSVAPPEPADVPAPLDGPGGPPSVGRPPAPEADTEATDLGPPPSTPAPESDDTPAPAGGDAPDAPATPAPPPAFSSPGPAPAPSGESVSDAAPPAAGAPTPPPAPVPGPTPSAGPDVDATPAPVGEPEPAGGPMPPPPAADPTPPATGEPGVSGDPVPPAPGLADDPESSAPDVSAAPSDDAAASNGPPTVPGAPAPAEGENDSPQASAPEPGESASEDSSDAAADATPPVSSGPPPPNDPDVPSVPESGPPATPPPPGSSSDGEDVVVDVQPGGPPPPVDSELPESPSSGPSDDDPSSPGGEHEAPPGDEQTGLRYLGAGNTYAHPADVGDPIAVYDDYPLGPDGPVSVALYEGGASVVTYPNGQYYVTWHVDEHLNPVEFNASYGVGQYLDQRGYTDYGVLVTGNDVDVLTESIATARAFTVDDMDLEGYPGLADPAALGWEPVHEEINEAGQLVRYYETPQGEQIVHTVQRTDEMITNIVYPNGVMIEKLEYADEPYIYLWDEEANDWQQVVWDADYGGYLPAVWDPEAGAYVPVSPEAQYTYEELLAEWEDQELIFPDAIGYQGVAGEASVDPHAMIERFGEPEVTEGNGYYELTWHVGADGDVEMTQRLYNDGSGRVSVEFEDWVRASWVGGEMTEVEVYYIDLGDWAPANYYVEEWQMYFYSTPDPYTGEQMLAAFDPATETFVPGVLNEAGNWTVPAAYNEESGEWEPAVYDLAVGGWVLPENAVQPAAWDGENWAPIDGIGDYADRNLEIPIHDYPDTDSFQAALGDPDTVNYGDDYVQRVWDDAPFSATDEDGGYTFYSRYTEADGDGDVYPTVTQTIWEDGRIEWEIEGYLRIESYPGQEATVSVWDGDSWEPGYYGDGQWNVDEDTLAGGVDFDGNPLETPVPEADTDGNPHVVNVIESVNLHDVFNEGSGAESTYIATVEYSDGSIHEYTSTGEHYLLLDNGQRVPVDDGVQISGWDTATNTIELGYPDGTVISLDPAGNMTIDADELSGGQVSYAYYPEYILVEFDGSAWLFDAETGQPYSVADLGDPLGSMELYEGSLPLSLYAVGQDGASAAFATTNGTIFEFVDGDLHVLMLGEGDAADLGISTDYDTDQDGPPDDYDDLAGQTFGPDGGYPFPGDVAEIVHVLEPDPGTGQSTIYYYDNGSLVWVNEDGRSGINWFIDGNGNPADFSDFPEFASYGDFETYLSNHGYHTAYSVTVEDGNVVSTGIPFDGVIEINVDGMEGWQDPLAEYGAPDSMSFDDVAGNVTQTWTLDDGTIVTRTTHAYSGAWTLQWGQPPQEPSIMLEKRVPSDDPDYQSLSVWTTEGDPDGYRPALWDEYSDEAIPAVWDLESSEYVPAVWDAETGQWVEAVWDLDVNAYAPEDDATRPAYWDDASNSWVPTGLDEIDAVPPNEMTLPEAVNTGHPHVLEVIVNDVEIVTTVVIEYPDGSIHEFEGSGQHYLILDNGERQLIEDGVVWTGANYESNVVRLQYPNGMVVQLDPEGNMTIIESDFPDGLVNYDYSPEYVVVEMEDGDVYFFDSDNGQAYRPTDPSDPLGSLEYVDPGEYDLPYNLYAAEPGGGVAFIDSYGTVFEYDADGNMHILQSGFGGYGGYYETELGFATDYDTDPAAWGYEEPLDFTGQVYGPDGGYPFPGDVAEVVYHQEADGDSPQATFYSNGAVVWGGPTETDNGDSSIDTLFSINNASTASITWYYDANGNPADFSGLTPPVTQGSFDAYIEAQGYYAGYAANVGDEGNVVFDGIPWDYPGGIYMDIDGLEDWQDPAVEYGFDQADFTFDEYGNAVYTWHPPDGPAITRTTNAIGEWTVQYGTPPDAYQLANNEVYVWNEETGDWARGAWDPYLDRPMYVVYDEATGEYVPALWDETSGQYVAAHWDEDSGSWLAGEEGGEVDGNPPQYADNYIPDETYIPEVLDPIHPDTVLLRYPDGTLHEFGYDDAGQRYHYLLDADSGFAIELQPGDPYLIDLGPPPVMEFSETNHVLQPDGTMLLATGAPNQDRIVQSLDAEQGIVITETSAPDGRLCEYELEGDTTYVTYIYPDGTRSEPVVSEIGHLLDIDEASGTATFVDGVGHVFQLDGSGYMTILALPPEAAAGYNLTNYEQPDDPDYYLWDHTDGHWESTYPPFLLEEADSGDEGGDISGASGPPDNLGPDGMGYPNPYLRVWGADDAQVIDPQDAATFLQVDIPQTATLYATGAVGLNYPDGSYRVVWLEDIDGEPVVDWEQVATGNAFIDYQVHVVDNVVTAEIPAGSAVSTAVGEAPDAITPTDPDDGAPDEDPELHGVEFEVQGTETFNIAGAPLEEEPPAYPGFDASAYPDNDIQQVLEASNPDYYRAQLADGQTYEWTPDGEMYHIQVDANGLEYATEIQANLTFAGYSNGNALFQSSAGWYEINSAGQIEGLVPVSGGIQEIDAANGYVHYGNETYDLRGEYTYQLNGDTGEWELSEDIQLLELHDNPPTAIVYSASYEAAVQIEADGSATTLWVSESTLGDLGLHPGGFYYPDDVQPLYSNGEGWQPPYQEEYAEPTAEPASDEEEPPESEEVAQEQSGYLGPDGASYPHPFMLYESSPVVDAGQAADMLGWPEGTTAYLYPGGELVMMYGDGSTRIAWLQDAQTGAPVTSLDEAGNGQTVIDYAAQVDANGQLVSVLVQPGTDVLIESTLTFTEPDETEVEASDAELDTGGEEEAPAEPEGAADDAEEEELEPLDFSEEAPPEESEEEAPADDAEPPEEPEPADDPTFAQPDAEADPAAGLDPLPGAEEDGLPPSVEDTADDAGDLEDDDDGLP